MGLFDKRDKKKTRKDDFDSPVEQIDLSAAAPAATVASEPEPAPAASVGSAAPPSIASAPPEEPARSAAPAAAPAAADEDDEDDDYSPVAYGIDKAIELMRTLPNDNIELVVTVVKQTLESLNVRIPSIIKDASRKQDNIQGRIKVLRSEIEEYEQEIAARKQEIEELETDFKETSTVKERLEMAERRNQPGGAGAAAPRMQRPTGPIAARPSSGPSSGPTSSGVPTASSSSAGSSTGKTTVIAKK